MNEIVVFGASQFTLEANGALFANNAIVDANDLTISQVQSADWRNGIFSLGLNFGTAPTDNRSIDLIIQPLAFEGANGEPNPTATHLRHYHASFYPQAVTGLQWLYAEAFDLPRAWRAWLFNNGTNQSVPAGWILRYLAFTRRLQA